MKIYYFVLAIVFLIPVSVICQSAKSFELLKDGFETHDNAKIDKALSEGITLNYALAEAIKQNNFEYVKYFIEKGADLNVVTLNSTPLLALDIGNYLERNSEREKLVEYMVSKLLEPLKQKDKTIKLPGSLEIKLLIRDSVLSRLGISNENFVAIQLYNILLKDINEGIFEVQCDIALIAPSRIQMFEISSWSRKIMLAPDNVSTHMWLYGKINDDGTADMSFNMRDDFPHWSFLFIQDKTSGWKLHFEENQDLELPKNVSLHANKKEQDFGKDSLNYYVEQVNLSIEKNDFQKSIYLFDKLLKIDSLNPAFYFAKAKLYEKNNLPDEAIYCYSKSLEIAPNYFNSLYNLGVCFYNLAILSSDPKTQKDNFEMALVHLKNAKKAQPSQTSLDEIITSIETFLSNTQQLKK